MPLLNHSRKLSGTRRAVAFANQVFWRSPALHARDVLVDEIGEPVRVLDDAMELRSCLARSRTAESGGNRINKDEVCRVKKRILVVHHAIRCRHSVTIGSQDHALRSHTHVREKGSRARPSVVNKTYRT